MALGNGLKPFAVGRTSGRKCFVLVLIFSRLLRTAWLLGVDFTCPLEFQDGENILSCRINRTAITQAECLSEQLHVTLEKPSGPFIVKCFTPSFNTSTCIPQKPVAGSCWCNQSDGEIFEYVFVYSANRSQDEGAQLKCKYCVKPERPLDDTASPTCRNMSFASSVSQGSEYGGGNVVIYAIISVIVLAFILVIVAAFYRQCWKSCLQRWCKNKSNSNGSVSNVQGTHKDKDAALNV